MSNNVVIMNIKSWKQTYSTMLIIVQTLKSYHATFSIDLKRSKQKKSNISKLHKNDLLVESRYWKQMLRYRFSQKFQIAVQKKFSELEKKALFSEWKKRINQEFLIWMFKYKFDIDDYLKKFKTRLCVKNDFQSTNQNIYAITLIAKTFRVLMIISIVFNLKIWQYNVVNAFINSEIDEELYSECSNEFFRFDYCWKLNKALYICKTGKRLLMRYRTGSRASSSSARLSLESSCPGYLVTVITVKLNSRYQLEAFAAAQSVQITRCSSCSSFCKKNDCTSIQSIYSIYTHSVSSLSQSTHPVHSVSQHSVHSLSSLTQSTHSVHSASQHSVHSFSPLTQSTHSVHSASSPSQSTPNPLTQSTHPVYPPAQFTHSVHPPSPLS
jgi:hypothetical protein